MDPFELPDQLPVTVAELAALAEKATKEIRIFQARAEAGQVLSEEDTARFEYLLDSRDTITSEVTKAQAAEQDHTEKLTGLLDRAAVKADEPEVAPEVPAEDDGDQGAGADVVAEAEAVTAEAAELEPVTAATKRPVSFAGAAPAGDVPAPVTGDKLKSWEFVHSAPRYAEFAGQKVGTHEIAQSIASVQAGKMTGKNRTGTREINGETFASQAIARYTRPSAGKALDNPSTYDMELDRIINDAPGGRGVTAEALVAANGWGWCSPSTTDYGFCPTAPPQDLLSLPEAPFDLSRGGIQFPAEPDVSALITDLFHFTEAELEAGDGVGGPVLKPSIDLPCADTWVEYRKEVVGYSIGAGILQNQAWPELIEKLVNEILAAHEHVVSKISILKMVAASGSAKVVPTDSVLGATSSVLNGLALQATNTRLHHRLAANAVVEGVAPVWFREVLRADLAMREGLDTLDVSDERITGLLTARNIYLQFVSDWQTGEVGQPGHAATLRWPGFVDVMLFPAGTFFRALDNVVTFGVQYPLEKAQRNQYSHAFLEDSLLVGKRCYDSKVVRVPLCVNGAVGAREQITCTYTGMATLTKTITIGGSVAPTGGSFPVTLGGNTASIAWNSTNAAAKTAIVALDDGYDAADFTVTGGALPGTPLVVTYPAELGDLTATAVGLTGGTGTTVTVS